MSNDATSVSDGNMNIEYKQVYTSDTLLNIVYNVVFMTNPIYCFYARKCGTSVK